MTQADASGRAKKNGWYFEVRFVLLMLFVFGPFALPLVWLSPKFSIRWKIGATILAVILTVLLIKLTDEMLAFLNQRLRDIRDASGV